MKIFRLRVIINFIFVFTVSAIVACSPKIHQMKGGEVNQIVSKPSLTEIKVSDSPGSTQILVESGKELLYTSFTLSDPPRLIIDLSDISAGKFKEPIVVNKGPVKEIYVIEADIPTKATRIDIRLTNDSKGYRINKKEKGLVIDIYKKIEESGQKKETQFRVIPKVQEIVVKDIKTSESEVRGQKVENTAQKIEAQKGNDNVVETKPVEDNQKTPDRKEGLYTIRDIKVEASGNKINIVINADADIDAEIFTVEGKRIVIDVNNAKQSISKDEIPVEDNKLISRVRIGRHTTPVKKVRIVAELKENVTYDTIKGGKVFTLSISSKMNGKTPEKVVTEAKAFASKDTEQPAISNNKGVQKTPSLSPKFSGNRVSLDFQDADIINVLRLLAEVSKLNMVIGDSVSGKITIKMLDVPWDQSLDVVLKMKGLGKVYEDNVLRIDTLSNIAHQQDEEVKAKEASVRAEDLVTKISPINYAKASEIAESIKKTLSVRGDIMIDSRTNTLIIKDIKDKQEEINKLLKTLDQPTPQVLIEARIVQADSNFAKDLGVQWGGGYTSNPSNYNIGIITGPDGAVGTPTTGFAVNLPASGVAGTKGSVGFTFGKTVGDAFNLDLRLSAGETNGLTKVLSAPKIATLDNKEATIQQGESIPYKTVSQTGTKTEFIDATLTLKVTPKVTPDGHIAMNIKISKNRQGSIVVEGTPSINKKEATTEVLVKDGETTVIGGIYEITDVDNVSGVPWFYQVPVLGWLFKNTQKSNIKSELLIFITPKIIPGTT